jgi:hypothetical protein
MAAAIQPKDVSREYALLYGQHAGDAAISAQAAFVMA